jgi:parallel beta-helix repeat protein
MTRSCLVLCFLALFLASCPLFAATTYYVGSCHAGSYPTINAAMAAAPAGSSILVCPGTYAEQLIMSKQLTLHGMTTGNASGAVVALPAGGLSNTSTLFAGEAAAQIEVRADGGSISNIAVDGTAGTSNCPTSTFIGILFASGSSGTVNQSVVRNLTCSNTNYGLLAENGAGTKRTVTIEASSFHDIAYAGIISYSDQTPSTLTANITNNDVSAGQWGILTYGNVAGAVSQNRVGSAVTGIYVLSTIGTISDNVISGAYDGIVSISSGQPTITGNTVVNGSAGIEVSGGNASSNHISNVQYGIITTSNSGTVEDNHITNASFAGISFGCHSATVSGNFINETPVGITDVPASYTGTNTFFSVPTGRSAGSC